MAFASGTTGWTTAANWANKFLANWANQLANWVTLQTLWTTGQTLKLLEQLGKLGDDSEQMIHRLPSRTRGTDGDLIHPPRTFCMALHHILYLTISALTLPPYLPRIIRGAGMSLEQGEQLTEKGHLVHGWQHHLSGLLVDTSRPRDFPLVLSINSEFFHFHLLKNALDYIFPLFYWLLTHFSKKLTNFGRVRI